MIDLRPTFSRCSLSVVGPGSRATFSDDFIRFPVGPKNVCLFDRAAVGQTHNPGVLEDSGKDNRSMWREHLKG